MPNSYYSNALLVPGLFGKDCMARLSQSLQSSSSPPTPPITSSIARPTPTSSSSLSLSPLLSGVDFLVNKIALALAPLEECLSRNEQWINSYASSSESQSQGREQGLGMGQGMGEGQGWGETESLVQGEGRGQGEGLGWVASVLYGSSDLDFYPPYDASLTSGEGDMAPGPELGPVGAVGEVEVGRGYLTEGYASSSPCHQVTITVLYIHIPSFLSSYPLFLELS